MLVKKSNKGKSLVNSKIAMEDVITDSKQRTTKPSSSTRAMQLYQKLKAFQSKKYLQRRLDEDVDEVGC